MNVFDKKRKIYNSNEHNSNNNVAKCNILINYWCREYGIDCFSYNTYNNSCIHDLDSNNIKGGFEMIEKRFNIIESRIVKDAWFIEDSEKEFTFPTIKDGKDICFTLCKALNELNNDIKLSEKNLYKELLKRSCKNE